MQWLAQYLIHSMGHLSKYDCVCLSHSGGWSAISAALLDLPMPSGSAQTSRPPQTCSRSLMWSPRLRALRPPRLRHPGSLMKHLYTQIHP